MSDVKFKEKLLCGFKYDIRNCMNFHTTTQKSKKFTSMGYFCTKYMRFELKRYRRVIFHDSEEWGENWINPDLVVSKMAWGIGWAFIRSIKAWIFVHWRAIKHIMFPLENFRGTMCDDTEGQCKI